VVGDTAWSLVAELSQADVERYVDERADDVAPRAFLHARIDPQVATGLALTLAALAVVAATVVLGVFVVMIRGDRGVVDLDVASTRWAGRRTSVWKSGLRRSTDPFIPLRDRSGR